VFGGGVTSAEAHTGSYSLLMESVDFVSQDLIKADEKSYRFLEFCAKADEPWSTGPAYATVYYVGGLSQSLNFGGSSLSSGTWTNFKLRLRRVRKVDKVAFSVGESTPIYIDDVALMGK